MSDRYHGHSHSGRTATVNPARTSLPASIGYTSLYAGDMHVVPSHARQPAAASPAPREYVTTTTTTPAAPSPTTRTYAVTQDPRSQRPTTRDVTRGHRSSTLDSASGRPPVIIMTTQNDRPNGVSSHSSNARSNSPTRDDFRASEGQLYTQPASSIRSRSNVRPYSEHYDSDDFARIRDRLDSQAQADAYRSTRPSVVYPSNPRHSTATIDYGDDGYEYTNAGELVRYDLEHPQTSRSRKRESFDRGYYRPNINYNADQRTLNVNTSPDQGRNYITTTRQLETRGGPPPSTRGFDKIPRAYESTTNLVAPEPVPTPKPVITTSTGGRRLSNEGRRARPVSLYQEAPPRSQHHDDFYRTLDDDKMVRDQREQREQNGQPQAQPPALTYEPESYEPQTYETQPLYFHDDRVATRGFGIRTDTGDDHDYRRDSYKVDEPKKRSDENLPRDQELDYDERRRSRIDTGDSRRERRESKRGDEEGEKERSRFRDKIASGLGIAAAAVGIAPLPKNLDKRSKEEPKGRRNSDDDREWRRDSDRDGDRQRDPRDRSRTRDYERPRSRSRDAPETKRLSRTDSRRTGETVVSASDSDEGKKTTRRSNRNSAAFNPNDANELKQLKEQLAALKTDSEKDRPVVIETKNVSSRSPSPVREIRTSRNSRSPPESKSTREARSPSESKPVKELPSPAESKPTQTSTAASSPGEEMRGRELTVAAAEEKQVRVVSPPRDKKEDKPLKGILKAPKVSFPEDPNPLREGVAPHKEDKKLKEAPAGAKWTKISRKVVNPEALTIGKERFEVRDDFVIVLRVLSKDEIQAYASATQVLRERRRHEEDERERERDQDRDREKEDDRRKHRHRRHRDDEDGERDRDRDRDRRRRHRDDDDYENKPKDQEHHHHHRHHY